LMKSVVAAKAVLFPEAEEKTISAAGAYWNMEGEQHENHGVVASLATPAATFPKISGLLSSA